MKRRALLFCVIFSTSALTACGSQASQPSKEEVQGAASASTNWAYPMSIVPASRPEYDDTEQLSLPAYDQVFTLAQLKNPYFAADWQLGSNPPMPDIAAYGREPVVRACGHCHLPTGNGRSENAAIAGLPRDYIIAQMEAFRSGARQSSVPDRNPTAFMIDTAKAMSPAEIEAAADYFSGLQRQSFVSVLESDEVPQIRTHDWLYSPDPAGGTEPLGGRIIEMPEDMGRFDLRDPEASYVAYVPRGSIQKGSELAASWGDQGQLSCDSCHGADQRGMGTVPALAGLSPTYIVRQLYDFQTGARSGGSSMVMEPVVEGMDNDDMIALAAYLATLEP